MEVFMAKRAVQSIPNRVRRQTKSLMSETSSTSSRRGRGGLNYQRLLTKVKGNPLLLNAGIGVGAFFLVRSAIRLYKNHPEFSEWIRDNMDTVESKFREYKSSMMGTSEDEIADARH
jgi:hypothetical protein